MRNVLPVVQRLIVGISPMKVEILVKHSVWAGISKINCLIRLHGNENLHQGEKPGEHTFMGIFFDLIICLTHIHAAALELAVDQRHTVNQQHKIAPAIGQNRTSRLEHRLLGNLVATLSGGNLPLVINF